MILDNFENIATILSDFLKKNQVIFLHCEINDFRKEFSGNIVLHGKNESVQFAFPKNLATFIGILTWWLFSKDKILFTWDIKNLFSYFYHRLNRKYLIEVNSKIIDIKYGESFLGIEGKCPQSFNEAKERAKALKSCLDIHDKIHIPLATRVIPKIETAGFRDSVDKVIRYSCYDIEGQINGRLRCYQNFKNGVLAHNLKQEDRARFRPNQDHVFAVLDFRSMEVYMLQWLSGDERLGKIISSGRDIYSTVYSLLYGKKCDEVGRKFIKDSFLPIIYGMQASALANRLNVSLDDANSLLTKIDGFFAKSMKWIKEQQDKLKESDTVVDYYGRPRKYEDKTWSVRNAVVQGPSSIICLDKLIELHKRLFGYCEIIASIHDAYVLDIPINKLYDVIYYATEVLESESSLAPGMLLKIDINVGSDLDNVSPYKI